MPPMKIGWFDCIGCAGRPFIAVPRAKRVVLLLSTSIYSLAAHLS
jgi:hypothetical protein